MKKKIVISKPYIKNGNNDVFKKSIRLCSMVEMENPNTNKKEKKECYFEFDVKYEKYLCVERSDAFVMGLLTTAMENNMDIEFEIPISERLYYQMTTYYIPMVSKYNQKFPMNNIKLIGNVESKVINNEHAVATGCSGGVDSFYTMIRHEKDRTTAEHKLTHIVYSSSGTDEIVENNIKNAYVKNLKLVNKIADDSDLNLIACYNNLFSFYKFPLKGFLNFYTTIFGATAFALQKLISIYYVSSAYSIDKFSIYSGTSSATFDIFTIDCMNTENLSFYSTGLEKSRIEKMSYIADSEIVQKNLMVCGVETLGKNNSKYHNCSKCKKCTRTIFSLYALGKLDLFKESFDIDYFKNKISKKIGKLMANDNNDFTIETLKMAKINHIKIPKSAYVYMIFIYKPMKFLRKTFSNSLLARKIYYRFNLDYKLDGYRGSKYESYKDKIK